MIEIKMIDIKQEMPPYDTILLFRLRSGNYFQDFIYDESVHAFLSRWERDDDYITHWGYPK